MSTLADEVAGRLRDDIVLATFAPGTRLTEAQLCARYGVSRVPVREALKSLEAEGFVAAKAYAGVTVSRMDADDAADLFAVRRTIEVLTVKRCAARFRSSPPATEVEEFAAQLEALVETGCEALTAASRSGLPSLNTEFHLSLAAFSQNVSLLSLLRQVSSKIQWLYAMDVDVRGEHSWAEHRQIADAVLAGEVSTAGQLIAQHIKNSRDGYLLRHTARQRSG